MKIKTLKIATTYIKNYKIEKGENQDLIFQVASISKVITAICVMKLVEGGALKLNESANNHLKNWKIKNEKNKEEKITIEQLLSHTGGVSCSGFRGYAQNEEIPSMTQILEGKDPSNNEKIYCKYKKGKYRYSGGGYQILQKIIEDVTNESFEKISEKFIFKPLRMTKTSFSTPDEERASGFEEGREVRGRCFIYPEKAAAGLWTTSNDLAKFIIELQLSYKNQSNKIISKESINKILSPLVKAEGDHMGLGVYISRDKKRFYHTGHNVGYRSKFIADLKGNGVIILTNNENTEDRISKEIIKVCRTFS